MVITSDLKKRLNAKFFARLVAQFSSLKVAPAASHAWQKEQAAAIPKANFEANVASFGRMRMAALQT
jgi:hypothetical protein